MVRGNVLGGHDSSILRVVQSTFSPFRPIHNDENGEDVHHDDDDG
jgi:hypothetical protein